MPCSHQHSFSSLPTHSGSEKASLLWDRIQDELEELRVAAEKGVPIDLGDGTMIDSKVSAPPPIYVEAEERVTRRTCSTVPCVPHAYRLPPTAPPPRPQSSSTGHPSQRGPLPGGGASADNEDDPLSGTVSIQSDSVALRCVMINLLMPVCVPCVRCVPCAPYAGLAVSSVLHVWVLHVWVVPESAAHLLSTPCPPSLHPSSHPNPFPIHHPRSTVPSTIYLLPPPPHAPSMVG